MNKTTLVGRTGALAAGFLCLALAGMEATSHAQEAVCPGCPELEATIAYDTQNMKFTLEIAELPDFDYTGIDSVELVLKEGTTTEYVGVSFGPADVEDGVVEIGFLPMSISGSGTTAKLRFFDQTTEDEVYVDVADL